MLALDPRHPVAAELSERLNRHFEGQSAEARAADGRGARGGHARRARDAARPYPEAVTLATEADVLHRRAEYTVAAKKFLESRDRFEQARRDRGDAGPGGRRQPRPQRAAAAAPTPPPATACPPPVAAEPPPPPALTTLPPAAGHAAGRVLGAPANDEPAIRRVIADYERAIETRDLSLFRTVKPNLSGQEERTLRATFAQVRSHEIEMTLGPIEVDGTQARVRLTRQDLIDGKPFNFQQTLVLGKDGGAWTIREIGR